MNLENECACRIFLQPTDKEEIASVTRNLNPNMATVQNWLEIP